VTRRCRAGSSSALRPNSLGKAEPEGPCAELKERLRNQFQFFGDDMMMTGAIGEWAAPLGSGAVWREAQRLVDEAGCENVQIKQIRSVLTVVDGKIVHDAAAARS
jgi:hypothetical protein